MAKIVNVHRVDDETFYLVRLTPQEIKPLLPDGLDAENLEEGQKFIPAQFENPVGRDPGDVWPGDLQKLAVTLTPDEDFGFVVECPAIPGCISQGETVEEALANIQDAIAVSLANKDDDAKFCDDLSCIDHNPITEDADAKDKP